QDENGGSAGWSAERLAQHSGQRGPIDGFLHMAGRQGTNAMQESIASPPGNQENRKRRTVASPDGRTDLGAIQPRHLDVEQGGIEGASAKHRQCIVTIARHLDQKIAPGKRGPKQQHGCRVVVGNEDAPGRTTHLPSSVNKAPSA
ncbi:hypothetical protein OY671_012204, partial [Metschnikowia pulcherrima]